MSHCNELPSEKQKQEVTGQFLQLELDFDLFNIRPQGVPVWERQRWRVYRRIQQKMGLSGQAHRTINKSGKSYLKAFYLWLSNGIVDNPLFADSHEILFFGHPRRKLLDDGHWWDLYCDPIQNCLNLDALHAESPHAFSHKRPTKTENIQYIDFMIYTGAFKRKLGIVDAQLDHETEKIITKFEQELKGQFDINIDIQSQMKYELDVHASEKPLYKRFLSRVDPEVMVVVPGYGRETLLEACDDLGITTVELQHGVIHSHHLGYSYPSPRSKEHFPDYLFTWGEFWNNQVEYPVSDERVIPIGYPYLNQRMKNYSDVDSEDMILFISQGTIGNQLSKLAVEVSESNRIDFDVVYKLHPGEYGRWKEAYPWLEDSNVTVIDSSTPPLYKLFARASAQVGVGSTALYEGLAFDLNTFVYDLAGQEPLQPLIDDGIATKVNSANELLSSLELESKPFERDRFFRPNPLANFSDEIDSIL